MGGSVLFDLIYFCGVEAVFIIAMPICSSKLKFNFADNTISQYNTGVAFPIYWSLYGSHPMSIFLVTNYVNYPSVTFKTDIINMLYSPGTPLLTWFNFNPSMDK